MAQRQNGGRHPQIDEPVSETDTGDVVTAGQQIVERVRLGADYTVAASSAGIQRSTLHNWRRKGAQYRAALARGETIKDRFRPYVEFVDALDKAEAEAEIARLAIIQKVAQGGAEITKRVQRIDAQGDLIDETVTTETLRPEWAAAAWWLERRRGYVRRMEVTGLDGAPVELSIEERAQGIADSLRDYLAGAADHHDLTRQRAQRST